MPRPLYVRSSPAFNPQSSHAGLWYDKFCDQWQNKQNNWTFPAEQKLQWIRKLADGTPVGDATLLSQFAARQKSMAEALGGKCFPFHAESRFVTGLGREHPVENGFAWHPTLGTLTYPVPVSREYCEPGRTCRNSKMWPARFSGRNSATVRTGKSGWSLSSTPFPLGR